MAEVYLHSSIPLRALLHPSNVVSSCYQRTSVTRTICGCVLITTCSSVFTLIRSPRSLNDRVDLQLLVSVAAWDVPWEWSDITAIILHGLTS
jgi:hypothetical protein